MDLHAYFSTDKTLLCYRLVGVSQRANVRGFSQGFEVAEKSLVETNLYVSLVYCINSK